MQEILPVMAGGLVAAVVSTLASRRLRLVSVVLLSVSFGVAATVATGEFRVGREFLAVDIPLVLLSALATTALVRTLRGVWGAEPTGGAPHD
jgi:hypothetical protein